MHQTEAGAWRMERIATSVSTVHKPLNKPMRPYMVPWRFQISREWGNADEETSALDVEYYHVNRRRVTSSLSIILDGRLGEN
jgi:hypothetical protein